MTKLNYIETARSGVIAGAAGGFAEIAWVTLYAGATGGNAAILARGVTTAVGANALFPTAPAAFGVAIHLTLAILLGIALAFAWRAVSSYRSAFVNPFSFALAALLGVWAFNFLIVLPIVSPAFVHAVPYAISLTSKLLFGLAAAMVLRRYGIAVPNARAVPVVARVS